MKGKGISSHVKRGGNPESEMVHARLLISGEAEEIWGWNSPAGRERVARRIQWIRNVCSIRPGLKVLECGCGTGIFTQQLAKLGAEITAVDISIDLLTKARNSCGEDQVTFLQTNLEDPKEIPDEYFDAMFGVSVLHHLDINVALPRIKTKLKPNGKFAFSEPNILNPINKHVIFSSNVEKRRKLGVSPHEMAFRPDELKAAFEFSGYHVDAVEHRDFLHPSIPRYMISLAKTFEFVAERLPGFRSLSGSIWISGRRF